MMHHDHHHHGHHHHHDHGGCGSPNLSALGWVLVLTGLYMIIEFIGGLWTNSLALIADAGHMLTDVAAVGLALFASWFAEQPASHQKTYGYYRLEILAAFLNGLALVAIAAYVIFEALQRMQQPIEIKGKMMIIIAVGGVIINLFSAVILFRSSHKNINVRAALLHVVFDTLGSLGAIAAGGLVYFYSFYIADTLFSIIIALLVFVSAWKLLDEVINILLEASPKHLNVAEIRSAIVNLPEVESVHDLHVWSITSGKDALSAHVVVTDETCYKPELVNKIQHELKEKFGLTHLTIQLETPDFEEDEIHFHF